MSLLTWKPEYSVGDIAVDHEHQQMIGIINSIYDELNGRNDVESIEQFLGDTHATIAAHFALEEQAMQKCHYSDYESHKLDHEELLDQIRELMDAVSSDPNSGVPLLESRLASWFAVHFSTFDAALHGNLHSKQ